MIFHNEVVWDWTAASLIMLKLNTQYFDWIVQFLGAFRKIAKSDFEFRHVGLPFRLSVCPHVTTWLTLDGFS